jgi:cell division septum initiation protein DivIVA
MDILRILDELHALAVDRPKTIPGLNVTFGLNKDEISMQIAKIRASLPNELKAAAATVRESERIVDTAREDAHMTLESSKKEAERMVVDARKEAERIVEQAKLQQERMVAESEILKLSKAQSAEIRNSADRDALATRRGAEKYAYDVLGQLENVLGKAMTTIEKGKQEMQKQPHSAPREAVVQEALPQRERVRV